MISQESEDVTRNMATAEILPSLSKDWEALSHTNGSSTDKHLGDPVFRPLSIQFNRMHMAREHRGI